jgi:pyridoxal phosphate enzyme (YggS family)
MTASDAATADRIRENLTLVREKIAAAATRSGRNADQIKLVGVTKYVEPQIARLLVEAGVTDLGESRPQELWRKAEALADLTVNWHAIGHLQRNKVRRTLECSPLIHSVDSLRLLEEINRESASGGKATSVLLEVNISGDAAKHGLLPNDVESHFLTIIQFDHINVRGLMTMSGLESGPDQTRREFAELRELAERLSPKCSHNICMDELSMGMSDDYEIAIEEGATIVRIGSALFEGVKP